MGELVARRVMNCVCRNVIVMSSMNAKLVKMRIKDSGRVLYDMRERRMSSSLEQG